MNESFSDLLVDNMTINFDVLRLFMKGRIVGKVDSGFVVTVNCRRRKEGIKKIIK